MLSLLQIYIQVCNKTWTIISREQMDTFVEEIKDNKIERDLCSLAIL